ncbi:hypothetical protein NYE25_06660 [Paenibacillus sp. FSL E2-8871]|uniref:hypothetical protein n=1 Tax=Paenibacillus TaxID=44249 RepID=UPI00117DAFCB|nr:hypothetical protein [Paenibacillus odorifer]
MDEERIREIVREEMAAAATTASFEEELQLIEIRQRRIEQKVKDPAKRQQLLIALKEQRCYLQSSLQQPE